MSEFMGLILGQYEAKEEGFCPGGATLHSIMTPHGPDAQAFNTWTNKELGPMRVAEETQVWMCAEINVSHAFRQYNFSTQAFMFETSLGLSITKWGEETCEKVDKDYYKCWMRLEKNFTPDKK